MITTNCSIFYNTQRGNLRGANVRMAALSRRFCRLVSHGLFWRFWTTPCPLLGGGGPGVARYCRVGWFLPVSPDFSVGNRLQGPNYSWEDRCCPESPIPEPISDPG